MEYYKGRSFEGQDIPFPRQGPRKCIRFRTCPTERHFGRRRLPYHRRISGSGKGIGGRHRPRVDDSARRRAGHRQVHSRPADTAQEPRPAHPLCLRRGIPQADQTQVNEAAAQGGRRHGRGLHRPWRDGRREHHPLCTGMLTRSSRGGFHPDSLLREHRFGCQFRVPDT